MWHKIYNIHVEKLEPMNLGETMIKKITQGKNLLLIGVLAGLFAIFVMTEFYGRIFIIADKTLDPLYYYTKDTFYEYIKAQGPPGRRGYLLLHGLDYIFMVCLALFLSGCLYRLTRIFSKVNLEKIGYLPLCYWICDFTENLLIDISLIIYPSRLDVLGHLAGYFTLLKFTFLYIILLVLILLIFFNILVHFLKKIA